MSESNPTAIISLVSQGLHSHIVVIDKFLREVIDNAFDATACAFGAT